MFSWADLGTPDAEGAKRFYSELLELDTTDMQMGEGMSYTMLSKGGKTPARSIRCRRRWRR